MRFLSPDKICECRSRRLSSIKLRFDGRQDIKFFQHKSQAGWDGCTQILPSNTGLFAPALRSASNGVYCGVWTADRIRLRKWL